MDTANPHQGPTLRQAAFLAGVGLLVMAVATPFAQFYVLPKLVVQGAADATTENIVKHEGLFVSGIFSFLVNFTCDLPVAWALYLLFRPTHAALSLLTAWFRLAYTAISFVALLNLVSVVHLVRNPEHQAFGAQVMLRLDAFAHDWGIAFVLFGIHLVLLGYLVYRSTYVPKLLAVLLAIAGVGYVVFHLGPYLFPHTDFGLLFITFFGEAAFMFWLLFRGAGIKEPSA
jgi:hypothetical protein